MSTLNAETYANWIGHNVVDPSGQKIGKISQVYMDDRTGQPDWLTVKTGLFGTRSSFVPLQGARAQGDDLVVNYDQGTVKGAPQIDDDGELSEDEERVLYNYYGQEYASYGPGVGTAGGVATESYDTSGPTTDDAMTRSEERLVVGTAAQEVGRARLRKYVVTENVQTTVPVSHEEVRVEREPITADNYQAAMSGPDISEEEHEVVLMEERPVVQKEVVPVERVRLTKETVAGQEEVTDQVRKEQIDTEGVEGANYSR